MKRRITLLAGAMALSLVAACNRAESPEETRQDVAEARRDAAENVAEQRQETRDAVRSEAKDVNEEAQDMRAAKRERAYDTAMARVEGEYTIEKQKCEALGGDAQESCKDSAKQKYDSAKAQIEAAHQGGRS